jgi:hypothetical protein
MAMDYVAHDGSGFFVFSFSKARTLDGDGLRHGCLNMAVDDTRHEFFMGRQERKGWHRLA